MRPPTLPREIDFCQAHLTIIWVASRTLFGRYLLGRLRTYGHQTWQGGPGGARKTPRENEILKFGTVAMEIKKFSHVLDNAPMMLNFLWWTLLHHTNLHAKNKQNLPCGFEDRASLATAWQPWLRREIVAWMTSFMTSLARVTSSRARDVACDVFDAQQIRLEVLSMPIF